MRSFQVQSPTVILLLLSTAHRASSAVELFCHRDDISSELLDFVDSCPSLSSIYHDGPYSREDLTDAIDQVCSGQQDGGTCGAFPFTECGLPYYGAFCHNQGDTVAAITVSQVFDCLFQDEETCEALSYCQYTEVLGANVCIPELEDERITDVIHQACAQNPRDVVETYADLAESKGEDANVAATNAAFALDFYCGRDELGEDYFPTNCPCEFGEFAKLHTYSNMVADGFGKAPLLCANNDQGKRMKRAFAVNTAAVAEWQLQAKKQQYRSCQANREDTSASSTAFARASDASSSSIECTEEAQRFNKALKYKKSAVATLNGMCITDPKQTGTEAFCFHRLKTMEMEVKKCLMPLVLGKTSTCTSECDALLSPVIKALTEESCCGATLQDAFSFHGNQDRPFLYALSSCTETGTYINAELLDKSNACPSSTYEKSIEKNYCLPLKFDDAEAFQETLCLSLEEETARALGFVPNQVELNISDTYDCHLSNGESAVTVEAFIRYNDELPDINFPSVANRVAVRSVLDENGYQHEELQDEEIPFADGSNAQSTYHVLSTIAFSLVAATFHLIGA